MLGYLNACLPASISCMLPHAHPDEIRTVPFSEFCIGEYPSISDLLKSMSILLLKSKSCALCTKAHAFNKFPTVFLQRLLFPTVNP